MKTRGPRPPLIVLLVVALAMVANGCAHKAKEAPPALPAPPAVAPQEHAAPTPPSPAPAPAPAPTPKVTASDFSDAFFDFDSYALRDDGRAALDKDAKVMRDNPTVNIMLEGHCDERGTVEYNLALGEKRANAAHDYLVNAGVTAARIQTISYGKERPFCTEHDETCWQQNRRTHFVLPVAPVSEAVGQSSGSRP